MLGGSKLKIDFAPAKFQVAFFDQLEKTGSLAGDFSFRRKNYPHLLKK
jgi:hypothetical protein